MTPKQQAEEMARKAVEAVINQYFVGSDMGYTQTSTLLNHIPLEELLEVARAARQILQGSGRDDIDYARTKGKGQIYGETACGEIVDLHDTLSALQIKLEEMEKE